MTQTYIGVDISRDILDIHDPSIGDLQRPNRPEAIRPWLAGLPAGSFLVFEATSRCDRDLRAEAQRAGIAFARINPLHGWHFAQSLNLPKTNRVDAGMLARLGAERRPPASVEAAPERVELAALGQRRDQLIRMQTQERNRLGETRMPALRRDIAASIRALTSRIERIDRMIGAHLAAHPALAHQARLLRSIPGIGPVAAVQLLAQLPQLGQIDRRAVASLAGLAPRASESGKWKGPRQLGPGRRGIRRCLYMAALSVLRYPHLLGGIADRMRDRGKPGKVVAIAIARKLLTIANAVLRDQTPLRAT